MSFELILPFLRPVEHLILDPEISEIMINPSSRVFIERQGKVESVPKIELSEKSLQVALKNIARLLGDDISESKPILDARFPDGSRIAAVIPPCSIHGTTITIRKFAQNQFSIQDLIRLGTLDPDLARLLEDKIEARSNVLISGGTSTGKTKTRPRSGFTEAISSDLRPDASKVMRQPSLSGTCSGLPSGTGRTESSSERFEEAKPLISCKL
jgi:pilus assembly protein CpaF